MLDLDAAEIAALGQPDIAVRDFLLIDGKAKVTGETVARGYWVGIGAVSAPVIDRRTGIQIVATFHGDGSIVSVGKIQRTADISVRSTDVVLSQLVPAVNDYLRGTDVRHVPIQIWRGYLDPATKLLVAPAKARLLGFVDEVSFATAASGGESGVTLKCVTTTRELTRINPDVRSHESQQARHSGDDFLADVGTVGERQMFWGQEEGTVAS